MSEPRREKGLPDEGPWRCGHFGYVWTGDISDHHGLVSPAFCPGPHLRSTVAPNLAAIAEHAKRLARGAAGFAADMRAQGIHVGMGSPARCVNCGEPWPCPAEQSGSRDGSDV